MQGGGRGGGKVEGLDFVCPENPPKRPTQSRTHQTEVPEV